MSKIIPTLQQDLVMPEVANPRRPPGSQHGCKSKEPLFEPARGQSHTHANAVARCQRESEFQETKILWVSRAVCGVRVVALADWLGLGVVSGVTGRGSGQLAGSRGGGYTSC